MYLFSFVYLYFDFIFFCFVVFYLKKNHLRDRGLHVVVLEVALKVEDSHLLGLSHLEELAKSRVRVDVLLVV